MAALAPRQVIPPIVALLCKSNSFLVKPHSKFVLPTPLSPIRTICMVAREDEGTGEGEEGRCRAQGGEALACGNWGDGSHQGSSCNQVAPSSGRHSHRHAGTLLNCRGAAPLNLGESGQARRPARGTQIVEWVVQVRHKSVQIRKLKATAACRKMSLDLSPRCC